MKYNLRTLTDKGLFQKLIAFTVVTGSVVGLIGECNHKRTYEKAESYAIRTLGDKVAPLTIDEQKEWFERMGIQKGKRPSKKQLNAFINNNPIPQFPHHFQEP